MNRVCIKCCGTGYVMDRVAAVFTFGIGLAIDWLMNDDESALTKEICGKCDGKGIIYD